MKNKILVIVANYYEDISSNLTSNAKSTLLKKKIKLNLITVPGVFEGV